MKIQCVWWRHSVQETEQGKAMETQYGYGILIAVPFESAHISELESVAAQFTQDHGHRTAE